MAGALYIFDPAERFVVGTIGEPGERAFYLQAKNGRRVSSVLLEKDQVAAMAERLGLLLRELKRNDSSFHYVTPGRDDEPLETPVVEEFRVGAISLSWLSDRSAVLVELLSVSENLPDIGESPTMDVEIDASLDRMQVVLTPGQTELFIHRALAVIGAGRPPCPFCGIALDPRGHVCPRANGYRR